VADILAPPPWNLLQLVAHARLRLDDLPGDIIDEETCWDSDDAGLLWSNMELVAYADEAQWEFARRRPVKDSVTTAVCQVAISASTAAYAYHASILGIERARFVETVSGKEHPLVKATHTSLDDTYPRWQSDAVGDPRCYIEDTDERRLTLYRTPQLAGTLYLTVRRLPLVHFDWVRRATLRPEIAIEHHAELLDWMLYRAYLKRDAETERPAAHLEAFDRKVGPRPSAHLERVRRVERNTHRRVRGTFF
jgi:hypothetical protein